MKTRTLLLLAVAVGLVILVAGTIQLLRVSDRPSGTDDLAVGETARAGDLEVTVVSAVETSGVMRVQVRTSGVDDEAGFEGFRLIGIGAAVRASESDATEPQPCVVLKEETQTCTLAFATEELEGSTRVLLVRRGEDQRRWSLR
jgi:hypothetical protein